MAQHRPPASAPNREAHSPAPATHAGALPLGPREGVRVLLVDRDGPQRESLVRDLRREGHLVLSVERGERALVELERAEFDAVIAEVDLPGMSGLELCRQIRARSGLPVTLVAEQASREQRLAGFDLGADDYLLRPLDAEVLDRRVRALARRHGGGGSQEQPLAGPAELRLDPRGHQAFVGARELQLTPKEFALLELLLQRQGEVLDPDTLSREIWGYETFGSRNFVEAHLSRLRAKLARAGASDVVGTVRGVGYVIR